MAILGGMGRTRWAYAKVAAGTYQARPVRVFAFDEIVSAHQVMEAGQALGKMVVTVP